MHGHKTSAAYLSIADWFALNSNELTWIALVTVGVIAVGLSMRAHDPTRPAWLPDLIADAGRSVVCIHFPPVGRTPDRSRVPAL